MQRKWSRFMVKATIGRTHPLTPRLCTQMEAENPWTMRCYLFLNFVNVSYETLFLIFVFLEGLQLSMEWLTRGRQDL
jgi:hypothetical protein